MQPLLIGDLFDDCDLRKENGGQVLGLQKKFASFCWSVPRNPTILLPVPSHN